MSTNISSELLQLLLLCCIVHPRALGHNEHWVEAEVALASLQERRGRRILREHIGKLQPDAGPVEAETAEDEHRGAEQQDGGLDF